MAVVARPLFTSKYAVDSETTQYTATNCRCIIDKFTAFNTDSGALTLTVKLIASGGSASADETIMIKQINAGESYTFPEVVGHVLEAGGFISTLASTTNKIVIRASGREVTS
jgi:hypothetical protein